MQKILIRFNAIIPTQSADSIEPSETAIETVLDETPIDHVLREYEIVLPAVTVNGNGQPHADPLWIGWYRYW